MKTEKESDGRMKKKNTIIVETVKVAMGNNDKKVVEQIHFSFDSLVKVKIPPTKLTC